MPGRGGYRDRMGTNWRVYAGLISVSSRTRTAPQLPHTSDPSTIMKTAMESHLAQAAVGSAASGGGSGGLIPSTVRPVSLVTGSKVVPQLEQTWLKQQLGVQL